MLRPGICSVTYRDLPPEEIVSLSAEAGLECIEWGGDVHVAPGVPDLAEYARARTEEAGLAVASLGSYLRFIGTDEQHATRADVTLVSAEHLRAPRLRVWAGTEGSAAAGQDHRELVTRRLRDVAERAGKQGIEVGLEFHRGTLTDTVASTLQLLEDVAHPNLTTYWQPNVGLDADEAIATLRAVRPHVSTIHVFSWWPRTERLPLSERSDLWRRVFAELADSGRNHDVLLEFVPGDDPDVLAREAATLRELIDEAESGGKAAR